MIMFELDQFIADCRAARTADKSHNSYATLSPVRSRRQLISSNSLENQNAVRYKRFIVLPI